MSEILPAVIGVDLGASFTKVSLRPAWTEGSHGRHYRERSRLVVIDGSSLIPSLMIYSEQHKRWLAGQEAANYLPKEKDQVFSNWKRSLYSNQLDQKVDGDMEASTRFFEWLGSRLKKANVGVEESVIKICLPAFEGAEKPARMLLGRMQRCGWAGRAHTVVSEPGSNTVGFFGEGSNAANRHQNTGEKSPVYMENFPQGGIVLNHLRKHALNNGPRLVTFIILDIGSFTADISVCTIDAQLDGNCLRDVRQHSFELGLVEHYEDLLFESLLDRRKMPTGALTFSDKERIKRTLNSNGTVQVAVPGGGSVSFGEAEDIVASNRIAEEFANRLVETVSRFLGNVQPSYCVMTGGGASIAVIRNRVGGGLQDLGTYVLPGGDVAVVGPDANQIVGTVEWTTTGESLERLATALGASSVLMDLPTHEPPEERPVSMSTTEDWIYCSCNGGNKNCQKCDGIGMYKQGYS